MSPVYRQHSKEQLMASKTRSTRGIEVTELEIEEIEALPAPFETVLDSCEMERIKHLHNLLVQERESGANLFCAPNVR